MKENKYCIFHVPNYISQEAKVGSQVRPKKMIDAFKSLGYQVDIVMGYGKERKKQIKIIKKNIKKGYRYDFLYSESSTMPTLLTEKNHIPIYPVLDFGFMNFCKKQGLKIGLFYRDIYWKFPIYKKGVSLFKRMISIPMYKYDLRKYEKLLKVLYLPSNRMGKYLGIKKTFKELPPGSVWDAEFIQAKKKYWEKEKDYLSLFYVGGIGEMYDLTKLLIVIEKLKYVRLTICCREAEWQMMKEYYHPYLNERVKIIHKSGEELKPYYLNADICSLFFESEEYRSFAMPIKLFEYLSHLVPIIATTNTSAGEFVERNRIGWTIPYEEKELENLLNILYHDRKILNEKDMIMEEALRKNTWIERAKTVIEDLV